MPQKCILWGKFHGITQFCPASFSQKVLSAYYDPIHCGCQMRPSFSSSSTNSSSFKSLAILSTRLWFWFQVAQQSTHHLKEDRQTSHSSTVGPVHSSKAFIGSLHQSLHLFTLLPLFVGLYNSTHKKSNFVLEQASPQFKAIIKNLKVWQITFFKPLEVKSALWAQQVLFQQGWHKLQILSGTVRGLLLPPFCGRPASSSLAVLCVRDSGHIEPYLFLTESHYLPFTWFSLYYAVQSKSGQTGWW